jgi:hypothetical protein
VCTVQTIAETRDEQAGAETAAQGCPNLVKGKKCDRHGKYDGSCAPTGCMGGHPAFAALLEESVCASYVSYLGNCFGHRSLR